MHSVYSTQTQTETFTCKNRGKKRPKEENQYKKVMYIRSENISSQTLPDNKGELWIENRLTEGCGIHVTYTYFLTAPVRL